MRPLTSPQIDRLWEAVQRTSRELVWEVAPDGTLTFLTDAAADVLGAPADELVGRNGFDLVAEEDRPYALHAFAECIDKKQGWSKLRVRVVRPDGRTPWAETSGVIHLGIDGDVLGWTATTRLLDAAEIREVDLDLVRQRVLQVIDGRSLDIVWQPIFGLADGMIVGAEALTRFRHPVQQGPDRWFADAADVGLAAELEGLAIELALHEARSFPSSVYLSINASPAVVSARVLPAVLEGSRIAPERIVLELTEHVSVDDYAGLILPLSELRSRGVRLAVDDAGAGFASFRHILRLSPEIIKLDQSIVHGIRHNPAQRALATAVVLFGMEAGNMTIVAEGVETADDLETISLLGVDAAQGYHLARPKSCLEVDWYAISPI